MRIDIKEVIAIFWKNIASASALASVFISIVALVVAIESSNSTTRISTEALETSRQANSIALGLLREPAVVEFGSDSMKFDLTNPVALEEELKTYLSMENEGKRSIDALAIEVVGVDGLTYGDLPPLTKARLLPSVNFRLDLKSALQPGGGVHIDARRILLVYLQKLMPLLPPEQDTYTSVVNIVVAPKAVNESSPAGAGTDRTRRDRILVEIRFKTNLLEASQAKAVLASNEIQHRIFDK